MGGVCASGAPCRRVTRVECDVIPLALALAGGITSHSTLSVGGGAALRGAVTGGGVELDLAEPDRRRRHLDALVLAAELQRLLQRQLAVRDQPDELIAGRRAHVGELLLLGRVDV